MGTQTKEPISQRSVNDWLTYGPLRLIVSLAVPIIAFLVLRWAFILMRDQEASKWVIAIVALTIGVGGVWVLYLLTYFVNEQLPLEVRERVRPFIFVGPAIFIIAVFLLYPIVHTGYLSLLDAHSEEFIGLKNYKTIFTEKDFLITLRNNGLWLLLVPTLSVSFGLVIAVLTDRMGRGEAMAKAFIFMPMAISAVGAGVVWKFMYFVRAEGETQIGLLNAIYTGVGGGPVNFLDTIPLNTFALLIIMIWMVTGYAMVVISAAVKNVSTELLEAARIDGANEVEIFFRIIIPVIRPTLLVVGTTILIWVLKVFDIVYVMTHGRRDTEVVANKMFKELFEGGSRGVGSALAIILLIAVSPFIVSNVRELRERRG
jgi:alpha-glucoside transport system permease protein